MGIETYNPSAALNATLGGFNIAEGMARADVDDALRQLMADLAVKLPQPENFGAVGNGTTDDTAALTSFFNHAIANPGAPHFMPAKTYAVTAALPSINVSSVWIEGRGAHQHDGGSPQISGTVIKYTGAAALTAKLVEITSVSGLGNQRVANVKFRGIGLDCNNGLIGYGLSIRSIRDSDIEVLTLNAGTRGVDLGVVAALAEDKNIQRCRLRLYVRQSEVAVPCLYLDGDGVSDVSMNEFWVDAIHKDAPGIVCANSDNNDWRFCRVTQVLGGTATDSVQLLGGASSAVRCRAELFHHFSATLRMKAFGTEAYTVASTGHQLLIDADNGTPAPALGTGAVIHYISNNTAAPEDAWISYTPTLVSAAGAITTVGAVSGSYRKIGKRVEFKAQVAITTNGTGATSLSIGLPVNAAGTVGSMITGRETALTGKALTGFITTGGSTASVLFYDGTYPGADGRSFNVSGFYEVA